MVDASDPSRPRFSTNLMSPAMLDAWESLRVHEGRGLLAGVLGGGPVPVHRTGAAYFDVYDVASDCAHPRLLASAPVNGLGHEGNWAPDGRTYYATGLTPGLVTAIDVSDPAAPRRITTFSASTVTHGLGVSPDGTRLYLAHVNEDYGYSLVANRPSLTASNGLGIYDVSQIADRRRDPQVKLLASLTWTDGAVGQHAFPIISQGRPYVVFVEEGNHGGPRVIDVTDERHPRIVSKLKLEIQMPENRELAIAETTYNNENGPQQLGYNCSLLQRRPPRRSDDPRLLQLRVRAAGLRHPRRCRSAGDRLLQPGR